MLLKAFKDTAVATHVSMHVHFITITLLQWLFVQNSCENQIEALRTKPKRGKHASLTKNITIQGDTAVSWHGAAALLWMCRLPWVHQQVLTQQSRY
jgi:hypothetical protein